MKLLARLFRCFDNQAHSALHFKNSMILSKFSYCKLFTEFYQNMKILYIYFKFSYISAKLYINCILIATYLLVFSIAKIALGPPFSQKNPRLWKSTRYARWLTLPNKTSWLRPWVGVHFKFSYISAKLYINCILIATYLLVFSIAKIALGPPFFGKCNVYIYIKRVNFNRDFPQKEK